MNKNILKIGFLGLLLLFAQCAEDDNENIIDPGASCSDGIQNGDEEGIDCGGSCPPCDGEAIPDFAGVFVQEDRVGRPGTAHFYVTYGFRDDFNTMETAELPAWFAEDIGINLLQNNPDFTQNIHQQDSATFTNFLARDVLWVATNLPTTYAGGGYTYTGRQLTDDVMDYNLLLLFGGPDSNNPENDGSDDSPLLITDHVDANDREFLNEFPFLAPPH